MAIWTLMEILVSTLSSELTDVQYFV